MNLPRANPGKKLEIVVNKKIYLRYPIKTSLVTSKDTIVTFINTYAKPLVQKGDVLVISERCLAIMQGRSYLIEDIHPSQIATVLSKFVSRHPGGIGLRSPWTMQLAIQEAGLPRILLAGIISAITRPFGIKGLFYQLVGNDINAIDGPCDYTLPPGNKSAKLGPKNPMSLAKEIGNQLGIEVVIIDANDYGVRLMGWTKEINKQLIKDVFKDNPLGQTNEQTPMAIVREK